MQVKRFASGMTLALAVAALVGATSATAFDRSAADESETRRVRLDATSPSLMSDELARIERANQISLQHELVRLQLKEWEVPFDKDVVLEDIERDAVYGIVASGAIDAAVQQVDDINLADQVEVLLEAYATWLAGAWSDPGAPVDAVPQELGGLRSMSRETTTLGSELPTTPVVMASCALPMSTIPAPTATCQVVNGNVTAAQDNYYQVTLTAGRTVQLTTSISTDSCAASLGRVCLTPGPVPSPRNTDPVVEIWNPACTGIVAVNDDACGLQSLLRYTPTASGNYRFRVRGFAGRTGNFKLSYVEEGCGTDRTAPTITILGPTSVTIDCAASVPPAPAVSVTDNCDPSPTVTGPTVTTVTLGCPGNRRITRTWTASDRNGNRRTATQTINLRDTRPPVLTPSSAQLACLWPPNHGMVAVPASGLSFSATDDCSPPLRFRIVGVTSSQCDDSPCPGVPFENGDGSTTRDAYVSEDGQTIFVRAERAGTNPAGRLYTVQVVAIDACGNTSAPGSGGTILVPHDQDEKSPVPCLSAE